MTYTNIEIRNKIIALLDKSQDENDLKFHIDIFAKSKTFLHFHN